MTTATDPSPTRAPGRGRMLRRVLLVVAGGLALGLLVGGIVVFGWMIDETRFDRPSEPFDAFVSEIEALPGVDDVESDRWAEAPAFWSPMAWIGLSVDRDGLPGLLDAACASQHPDAVTWSILVHTPADSRVSLNGAMMPAAEAGATTCPEFEFDALRVIDELDRVAPGLTIQPTIWHDGVFGIVDADYEAPPAGFDHLLPLVEHSATLAAAAGRAGDAVEINAMALGMRVAPGEADRWRDLLAELSSAHGATTFFADDGGSMTDGRAIVQLNAPESQRAAIEQLIGASGLPIADYPVRFLES